MALVITSTNVEHENVATIDYMMIRSLEANRKVHSLLLAKLPRANLSKVRNRPPFVGKIKFPSGS